MGHAQLALLIRCRRSARLRARLRLRRAMRWTPTESATAECANPLSIRYEMARSVYRLA